MSEKNVDFHLLIAKSYSDCQEPLAAYESNGKIPTLVLYIIYINNEYYYNFVRLCGADALIPDSVVNKSIMTENAVTAIGEHRVKDATLMIIDSCQKELEPTKTGFCGEVGHEQEVVWELNKLTKELTASGTGKMADYAYSISSGFPAATPWADYSKFISSVIIGDGITHIGNSSFCNIYIGDCKIQSQ